MAVKYLTRRTGIEFIKNKFGVPFSKSILDKSRMHGEPKPDKYYGNKELFTEKTFTDYALTLLSDEPVKLINDDKTTAA
jgi:hypothetical protein